MLVFFILAILDMYIPLHGQSDYWSILLVVGGLVGAFFAFSQIYNGTAIYQFVTGVISTIALVFLLVFEKTNLAFSPVASFYLGLIVLFDLVTFTYILYLFKLKTIRGEVLWDKSGGSGERNPGDKLIDRLFRS